MTFPAIIVEKLVKRFDAVTAVDSLDFEIPRGATAALLGGNGAGKTTTLSMLLGILIPSSGRIQILGHDLRTHRAQLLPRMNFSSPYVDLPHRLTVAENLRVYGHLYGVRNLCRRLDEVASMVDIAHLMDRPAGKLSAGQKTRVALAKAFLNEPELLLLDEPTASLDPDTADWVRSLFSDYQKRTGATILLASHNMTEVERLCDSVLIMKAGRLVDQGAPRDLIERYGRQTMEEVFLDIARERRAPSAKDAP